MDTPTLPILRVPRAEFIADRWDYRAGQHVTILAPTGNGKTTLAYELLDATATEQLPAVSLVMKPRDATAQKFTRDAGFRRVATWPPMPSPWHPGKSRGYTLWPRHQMRDHDATLDHQAQVFHDALTDSYARGNRIVFGDELYSLDNELGLRSDLVCLWTKGRSMGAGLWGASQKPSHVPLWAYSQAVHIFLSWDPDVRAQQRYGEIGGMDPALIRAGISQLEEFEWVYVHRAGRQSSICIVEA